MAWETRAMEEGAQGDNGIGGSSLRDKQVFRGSGAHEPRGSSFIKQR